MSGKIKGVFLPSMTSEEFNSDRQIGIINKIKSEIAALETISDVDVQLFRQRILRGLLLKIWISLPFSARFFNYKYNYDYDCDYVYLRWRRADRYVYKFLKELKTHRPDIKIIVEIPTYPYDGEELIDWKKWLAFAKDLYNRKRAMKYVDRIVTYSNDSEIWGVKTIRTTNGIDVEKSKTISAIKKNFAIVMITAASQLSKVNGLERIIDGMRVYYENGGTREIILRVVGSKTPERDYYEKLSDNSYIKNRVIFYDRMKGSELDAVFEDADIGVDFLGVYKNRLEYMSSLKTREFLARGLPIVSGQMIDVVERGNKYCLEFPNSSEIVDVNKIIEFYDRVYGDETRETVVRNIRSFAERTIDMKVTFKPIFDFINGIEREDGKKS